MNVWTHTKADKFGPDATENIIKALDFYKDWIASKKKAIIVGDFNNSLVFDEKNLYLQENDVEEIPDEHSIQKWEEFLPPLVDITNSTFENVSENTSYCTTEMYGCGNSKIIYR